MLSAGLLFTLGGCGGTATAGQAVGDSASVDRVRAHVEWLASDAMRGRQSGTPEYDRAAEYVETHLTEFGLDPLFEGSYRQPFTVQNIKFSGDGGLSFSSQGSVDRFAELEDVAFLGVNMSRVSNPGPLGLAYVGLGIHEPEAGWDDYAGIDLTDRCAVMTLDTPAELVADLPPHLAIRYGDPRAKAWVALRLGAACVIAFPSPYAPANMLAPMRSSAILLQQFLLPQTAEGAFVAAAVVSSRVASRFLGTERPDVEPGSARVLDGEISFDVSWDAWSALETSNIGAVIPGSDPQLRDQVIVLSAHLDGQGMSGQEVLNSANDNASSVAALLETARLLADAAPKRTVHLLFTAMEEAGLLGSEYFVDNPPGGAPDFRLNVNMEMIGKPRRSGRTHDFRVSSRVAPALESLVRDLESATAGVTFNYSHRSDDDGRPIFRRADHVNFFLRGIPTLYFYGGGDAYHEPSDDADGINFEKVATMADLLVDLIEATDQIERLPSP